MKAALPYICRAVGLVLVLTPSVPPSPPGQRPAAWARHRVLRCPAGGTLAAAGLVPTAGNSVVEVTPQAMPRMNGT